MAAAAPVLVDAPARGNTRAVRIQHGPAAVSAARRAFIADVSSRLDCEGSDDVASEAAVVVSELLGNAVLHARALDDDRVLMRWHVRGEVVEVEVTDGGGDSRVVPARRSRYASHGRGLRIVRSLAHEWGVDERDDGRRTVWAVLGGPSRRRHQA